MKLFMISLMVALFSGHFAFRFDEHRSSYLAICVASAVMALVSAIGLVPDVVWVAYAPHIWGMLLVAGFWLLRTHVRKALLN